MAMSRHWCPTLRRKPRPATRRRRMLCASNEDGYGRWLLGRYVGRSQASVDEERCSVHVARFLAGKEQGGVGDLARLGQPSHRQVHAPALVCARVLVEDPHQQRRLDRSWTESVDAYSLARELHRELAAHG